MSEIIIVDPLRKSVEAASEGRQTVLWTKSGYPSYMTIIPKVRLEDLHPSLGTGPHPAFVVNGVEKSEIFIASYQAVIQNGEALSLPNQAPETNINFDTARASCRNAGPGFHLMTNLEWAALALISDANGHDVRGNTNCGRSYTNPEEMGKKIDGSNKTLTGSGPASWRHDGTMFGVSDMVGNVWEWVDGLKLVSGQIHMPVDNDFNLPEAEWPTADACIDLINSSPAISAKIAKRGWDGTYFKDVAAAEGFEVPALLRQALLYPGETPLPGYFWADNQQGFETLPRRGGSWGGGSRAGLAALGLGGGRSDSGSNLGFRPAFIV